MLKDRNLYIKSIRPLHYSQSNFLNSLSARLYLCLYSSPLKKKKSSWQSKNSNIDEKAVINLPFSFAHSPLSSNVIAENVSRSIFHAPLKTQAVLYILRRTHTISYIMKADADRWILYLLLGIYPRRPRRVLIQTRDICIVRNWPGKKFVSSADRSIYDSRNGVCTSAKTAIHTHRQTESYCYTILRRLSQIPREALYISLSSLSLSLYPRAIHLL